MSSKYIEKLPLSPIYKVNLLLVDKRKKLATDMSFVHKGPFRLKPTFRHKVEDMEKLESLIKTIGFSTRVFKHSLRSRILISRNDFFLNELLRAEKEKDEYCLGLLYGFPKSATEAFLGFREQVNLDIIDNELPSGAFAGYIMSKDNWRKELEVAQDWNDTILKYSPHLHSEYINWFMENHYGLTKAHTKAL
jgi:hypothetical protein